MRKRLYFVLPDPRSASDMLGEMLLARIEVRRIHLLAKRGTLPADLPEATVFEKTDVVHGAQSGLVVGGLAGMLAGLFLLWFPVADVNLGLGAILITALFGALFGVWVSSMAGSKVANSKLKAFHEDIAAGKVLMMIDVPYSRTQEIIELVARAHPEAVAGGIDPTMPAFP